MLSTCNLPIKERANRIASLGTTTAGVVDVGEKMDECGNERKEDAKDNELEEEEEEVVLEKEGEGEEGVEKENDRQHEKNQIDCTTTTTTAEDEVLSIFKKG